MTISYSIIKKHDGHLLVHSEPGEGTTFVIYLQVSAGEESLRKTGKPADMQRRYTGRVLVMDDDTSILAVAANVFSWFGFSVTKARDGAETVREFREALESGDPFRLLVMDLTIPGGMGGKDAIRLIRDMDAPVKALASSGYSTDPIIAYYHDYGFDGVLNKPYMVEDIAEILVNFFPGPG